MTSVSAGHIILAPTQPVESGRPQWGSNLRPPHQESRALPTELPPPPPHPPATKRYVEEHRTGTGGGGGGGGDWKETMEMGRLNSQKAKHQYHKEFTGLEFPRQETQKKTTGESARKVLKEVERSGRRLKKKSRGKSLLVAYILHQGEKDYDMMMMILRIETYLSVWAHWRHLT